MKKTVGVIQSNYLPWKGYFDIIDRSDLFIFHDDLQYTKDDWRNRNKIKKARGPAWITIPCGRNTNRLICDVNIEDQSWQKRHWNMIWTHYHQAPFFAKYHDFFRDFYLGRRWSNLSELNRYFIEHICREFLGNEHTAFADSRTYDLHQSKGSRILELLQKVEATEYLSGPLAKQYLNEQMFATSRIALTWMDYSGYPEYPQFFPPFDHHVSIIDLLFHVGDQAQRFMKGRAWSQGLFSR